MNKESSQPDPDVLVVQCPQCGAKQYLQRMREPFDFQCGGCGVGARCQMSVRKHPLTIPLMVGALVCLLASLAFTGWAYMSYTDGAPLCVACEKRPAITLKTPTVDAPWGRQMLSGRAAPLCEIHAEMESPPSVGENDIVNYVPPLSYIGAIAAFVLAIVMFVSRMILGPAVKLIPVKESGAAAASN